MIQASTRHHLPKATTIARYEATGEVILQTDKDRKANNDHIICPDGHVALADPGARAATLQNYLDAHGLR